MSWQDMTMLANYNSEVHRGIMHADELKRRMAKLQEEYDEFIKSGEPLTDVPYQFRKRWWERIFGV